MFANHPLLQVDVTIINNKGINNSLAGSYSSSTSVSSSSPSSSSSASAAIPPTASAGRRRSENYQSNNGARHPQQQQQQQQWISTNLVAPDRPPTAITLSSLSSCSSLDVSSSPSPSPSSSSSLWPPQSMNGNIPTRTDISNKKRPTSVSSSSNQRNDGGSVPVTPQIYSRINGIPHSAAGDKLFSTPPTPRTPNSSNPYKSNAFTVTRSPYLPFDSSSKSVAGCSSLVEVDDSVSARKSPVSVQSNSSPATPTISPTYNKVDVSFQQHTPTRTNVLSGSSTLSGSRAFSPCDRPVRYQNMNKEFDALLLKMEEILSDNSDKEPTSEPSSTREEVEGDFESRFSHEDKLMVSIKQALDGASLNARNSKDSSKSPLKEANDFSRSPALATKSLVQKATPANRGVLPVSSWASTTSSTDSASSYHIDDFELLPNSVKSLVAKNMPGDLQSPVSSLETTSASLDFSLDNISFMVPVEPVQLHPLLATLFDTKLSPPVKSPSLSQNSAIPIISTRPLVTTPKTVLPKSRLTNQVPQQSSMPTVASKPPSKYILKPIPDIPKIRECNTILAHDDETFIERVVAPLVAKYT